MAKTCRSCITCTGIFICNGYYNNPNGLYNNPNNRRFLPQSVLISEFHCIAALILLCCKIWRTQVHFLGPLTLLFWTYTLGFKARVDPLLACFLTYVILTFTSGATSADSSMVSMVAENFRSTYLRTYQQILMVSGDQRGGSQTN